MHDAVQLGHMRQRANVVLAQLDAEANATLVSVLDSG
jgi:hypothetical protein